MEHVIFITEITVLAVFIWVKAISIFRFKLFYHLSRNMFNACASRNSKGTKWWFIPISKRSLAYDLFYSSLSLNFSWIHLSLTDIQSNSSDLLLLQFCLNFSQRSTFSLKRSLNIPWSPPMLCIRRCQTVLPLTEVRRRPLERCCCDGCCCCWYSPTCCCCATLRPPRNISASGSNGESNGRTRATARVRSQRMHMGGLVCLRHPWPVSFTAAYCVAVSRVSMLKARERGTEKSSLN